MKSQADFNDIQGLTRFAHAHLGEAAYLLLNVLDQEMAKSWLRNTPMSTAAKGEILPDTALQIAISAKGLAALGVKQNTLDEFSDEFIGGMADCKNRSRRLGDTGVNSPENWIWGGPKDGMPDMLLMVFARSEKLAPTIQSIKTAKFSDAFELVQTLQTKENNGKEHFGFVDGISQPKTDWQQEVSTDLHQRDRYSNLLALGEVLLGYPNEYGLYTDRPLIDPADDPLAKVLPIAQDNPQRHDLGKNGSYLVLRQLSQDASGFWQFIDQHAESQIDERERLAGALVGRQMDGQPLVDIEQVPIQGISPRSDNHFTYAQDPHGTKCPIGSHVRRANPRTGDYPPGVTSFFSRIILTLGFKRAYPTEDLVASSRFHRLLRRGRPYGDALSLESALNQKSGHDERGLHFISLGANISRQFEFVQNAWLSSTKFAGLSVEADPLLGNREPLQDGSDTDQFSLPQENRPAKCLAQLPQFVTVLGGAYFFMPGLAALRYLAAEKPTPNN
jgi:Dyp-type peroxidase family